MRRIRYSVAMSLDGYIAGANGEYDWIEVDADAAAGYFKSFYAQFDTALMGRKSYEQAGGGVSPLTTYVLSRTLPAGKRGNVTVLGDDALERVAALRKRPRQRHLALGRRRAVRQLGRSRSRRYGRGRRDSRVARRRPQSHGTLHEARQARAPRDGPRVTRSYVVDLRRRAAASVTAAALAPAGTNVAAAKAHIEGDGR